MGNRKFHFVGAGNIVYRLDLDLAQVSWMTHEFGKKIRFLLPFGEYFISITQDNSLYIWKLSAVEINTGNSFGPMEDRQVAKIPLPSHATTTCIIHPLGYLNKVLIGTEQGQLYLWNLKARELVYTFQGFGSAVVTLEQSPAVDVVGIGCEDGTIILHNLKFDQTLFRYKQDSEITSLSFSTDNSPILISGTRSGAVDIWELEQRRHVTQLRAHHGAVTSVRFLFQQLVFLSSSEDNSMKGWIFDTLYSVPRNLFSVLGNSTPPSVVKSYRDNAVLACVANGPPLRSVGIFDGRITEFHAMSEKGKGLLSSVKALKKEFRKNGESEQLNFLEILTEEEAFYSPISSLYTSPNYLHNSNSWKADIITCHNDARYALLWNSRSREMYKILESSFREVVTAATLSPCGSYSIIGTEKGKIEIFLSETGSFLIGEMISHCELHAGKVTAIYLDKFSTRLCTTGVDSCVRISEFRRTGVNQFEITPLHTKQFKSPINFALYQIDLFNDYGHTAGYALFGQASNL